CEVPGGVVTLEGNAGTFTVEPFQIAKHPVTHSQYRAFLEAEDGYHHSVWWSGLLGQVDKPGRQFNRRDNHPAENLCWLEAMAFCRWLGAKLGYEVRLPTEWEWQQAATGGNPANQYPWGPEWDGNCANTYESELSRSTAVGLYPHGISPVGALDMSGNVWEWCLNEYDNPRNVAPAGDARRVVRGGSWDNLQADARAGHRGDAPPNDRVDDAGVRVVCAAPIRDTGH
ncbi:MAG: SUMF1/EgtB/PvdO family nonheme iron enzyme, partial [Candidatus Competibacter sp.]|nr:SUMF1/EgtB/PvdO family nonheme iron enzyme [Candidatus Competibacter sp.]